MTILWLYYTILLCLQITRSDIRPHIKWGVSLVIAYGYFNFPQWVNMSLYYPRGPAIRDLTLLFHLPSSVVGAACVLRAWNTDTRCVRHTCCWCSKLSSCRVSPTPDQSYRDTPKTWKIDHGKQKIWTTHTATHLQQRNREWYTELDVRDTLAVNVTNSRLVRLVLHTTSHQPHA